VLVTVGTGAAVSVAVTVGGTAVTVLVDNGVLVAEGVGIAVGTGVSVGRLSDVAVGVAVALAFIGVWVGVAEPVRRRIRMSCTTWCRSVTSTPPSPSTSALTQSTPCGCRPRHRPTMARSIASIAPSPLTSGITIATAAMGGEPTAMGRWSNMVIAAHQKIDLCPSCLPFSAMTVLS
jgi:hypothetical protein